MRRGWAVQWVWREQRVGFGRGWVGRGGGGRVVFGRRRRRSAAIRGHPVGLPWLWGFRWASPFGGSWEGWRLGGRAFVRGPSGWGPWLSFFCPLIIFAFRCRVLVARPRRWLLPWTSVLRWAQNPHLRVWRHLPIIFFHQNWGLRVLVVLALWRLMGVWRDVVKDRSWLFLLRW